jgi:hypothetical protein
VIADNLGAPALASATAVCASQDVLAATLSGAVINGGLASGGVATFDVPRNIVAAWTNTAIITITGTDKYGRTQTEVSASGTSHTGKKAFKTITKITVSADVTGLTAGSGSVLGLNYRGMLNGFICARFGADAAETGTYLSGVAAQTTSSGDPRGTYAPSGTLDGSKTLVVIYVAKNGPDDTDGYGAVPV